jgi:uncharacterized protein (TIGR02118 family)
MTKVLLLAKKRPDLSADAFITYWRQVHAPLVRRLPGVRRYVVNAVFPDAGMTTAVCDGIGEIWFDSPTALQEALASNEGRATLADVANFCAPESGTVAVEEIEVVI